MQLVDEYVWNSFESGKSGFPFPSRSIFDNAPLTVNTFTPYLENLRKVLFDCDLKLAPPRWLAAQLMKKTTDEFKVYVDSLVRVSLPSIQLKATGGCGGYYASDLDDFYSITKLVQLQDRVISTSERCPGDPTIGTICGNAICMMGSTGVLTGDEIHWTSGKPAGCLQCQASLPAQIWHRQALTREQVSAAEAELQDHCKLITTAEAELVEFRQQADSKLAELTNAFRDRLAHMLQALQGEAQGLQQDLRGILAETLDAKLLDSRAAIAQKEAEVAAQRGELAAQRERIAVLEAKMAKAEVRHLKSGGSMQSKSRPSSSRKDWVGSSMPFAWLLGPCTLVGWLRSAGGEPELHGGLSPSGQASAGAAAGGDGVVTASAPATARERPRPDERPGVAYA